MAFGDVRGTLQVAANSITNPTNLAGSVAVQVNDLVFVALGEQTALTAGACTSSLVTTYTATNAGLDSGTVTGRAYWGLVTSAGTLTQISVAATASADNVAAVAVVFEGPFASSPLDASPALNEDIASPFTTNLTGTLAQADELIVSWSVNGAAGNWTATSPNVNRVELNTQAVLTTRIGSWVVSATTSVSAAWTGTNPTDDVLGINSFKQHIEPLKPRGSDPQPPKPAFYPSQLRTHTQSYNIALFTPQLEFLPGAVSDWGTQLWPLRIARTWLQGTAPFISIPPVPPETETPGSVICWPVFVPTRYPSQLRTWLQSTASYITLADSPRNNYDWPVPTRVSQVAITWTQRPYTLYAEPLPRNEYKWPVPPWPSRIARTWIQTPIFQEGRPINEYDWPLGRPKDRINVSYNYQAYPLATVEAIPFENYDWPVPRGKDRLTVSWVQPSNIDLLTFAEANPFLQTDWPLGQPKGRLNVSFTYQAYPLVFAEDQPFNQHDWPNPFRVDQVAKTWLQRPYTLYDKGRPHNQYDWPLRRDKDRLNVSFNYQAYPLATVEPLPFENYDWPVPRAKDRLNTSYNYQSYPVTFAELLPFENYDWPVPRAKDRLTVSWAQSTNIDLLTEEIVKPFAQYDWPVPRVAIHPIQLRTWVQSTPVLITSLEVQPQNQHDWPLPRVAARLDVGFATRPSTVFEEAQQPQNQHDWPVLVRADRVGKTWLNFGARQEPKPFGKQPFGPPLRPLYPNSLLTWSQNAGRYQEQRPPSRQPNGPPLRPTFALSTGLAGTPVNLRAMGVVPFGRAQGIIVPKPALVQPKLGTATNLLEAVAEVVPFNRRTDWTVYPRAALRYDGSQPSSIALLSFAAAPLPKNQYNWPVPRPARAKEIEGFAGTNILLRTFVQPDSPPGNQHRYPLFKAFYPFRSVGWINPYPICLASEPQQRFGQRRYIAGLEWQPWDRSSEPRGWPY